jgi:hypothetical protein
MSITDYFSITVIIGGVATILGWWLKSRLDSAIKHEYNQMLELFKTELGRSNVLHSERLASFDSPSLLQREKR